MTTQKKKTKSIQSKSASKLDILNARLGMITFEAAASGTLAVLMLLVSVTILIGESAGVRISVNMPEDGLVSPFQIIQFTFSEPFNPELASELIFIDPVHEGFIQWVNDSTMQFIPLKPFEKNKIYKLSISPGEITINGREVKKKQIWEFQVREPRVAYLTSENNQSILWSANLNGDDPTQLTKDEVKIISFDTAANGDFIIFTSANEKGGIDLWRVGREGGNESLLLNCGLDRCTTPVIAPDNLRVAYSREAAGPSPDLPFGSPRIWIFDMNTGETGPVYEDQQILGYNPSWSTDATRLASFDGLSDFIHLIDFLTGDQFLFASNTGGPVTWSPDSTKFLYTTYEQTENGGRTQVKLADLSINETITFIGEKDSYDYSYYAIEWSPREDRAVLNLRAGRDQLTQVLWVFDPTLLDGIIIANDPEYTYNSPQWDPWGNALLFQQFKLKGQYKPEIGLWQDGTSQSKIITQGILPQWLP